MDWFKCPHCQRLVARSHVAMSQCPHCDRSLTLHVATPQEAPGVPPGSGEFDTLFETSYRSVHSEIADIASLEFTPTASECSIHNTQALDQSLGNDANRREEWHVKERGVLRGIYQIEDLRKGIRDGTFDLSCLVWKEGWLDWFPISDVPVLTQLADSPPDSEHTGTAVNSHASGIESGEILYEVAHGGERFTSLTGRQIVSMVGGGDLDATDMVSRMTERSWKRLSDHEDFEGVFESAELNRTAIFTEGNTKGSVDRPPSRIYNAPPPRQLRSVLDVKREMYASDSDSTSKTGNSPAQSIKLSGGTSSMKYMVILVLLIVAFIAWKENGGTKAGQSTRSSTSSNDIANASPNATPFDKDAPPGGWSSDDNQNWLWRLRLKETPIKEQMIAFYKKAMNQAAYGGGQTTPSELDYLGKMQLFWLTAKMTNVDPQFDTDRLKQFYIKFTGTYGYDSQATSMERVVDVQVQKRFDTWDIVYLKEVK